MKIKIDSYNFCPICSNKLSLKLIDDQKVKVCTKCEFIHWKNPKPVVSILLHENKKVLMLQRANDLFKNYWVLPGGFMNYEETPLDAIKREVKEETKSDIEIEGLSGVYHIDNDPRGIHIDIIYKGILKGNVILNSENKNFDFFLPKKLPEKIAYKHREAINDWHTKGGQYD